MSIVIVDYHKGNLLSVERGLVGAGADVVVTDEADVIRAAERQGDPPEPFVGFESGFRAGRLGVVHAHMAGLAAPRRPAIGRVAP